MDEKTINDAGQAIMPSLYQKVFFGNSTPQEGALVLLDLLNFSEAIRDFPETNAGVYRHLGKRAVGLRLLTFTQFTENDGNLGYKGLIKLHETVDSAAKLKEALIHKYLEAQKLKEAKDD